jgi:hypothetical protein
MYNLKFKKNTSRYTKEELFDNIQRVWDKKGEQPIIGDMEVTPSSICFSTYYNRFGSWKNALTEFVKYKNGNLIIEPETKLRKSRKTINNSIKYDVMKRDNFKCNYCGKSPATDSNVELQIDHIIPVTKGGDNHLSNLKTICKDCNIGKYDKL